MSDLYIGVLLGDPRLTYPYAVDDRFGDEEYTALEHLERAQLQLTGYRFRWFDNHETLIDDLRDDPPDLVLNFCDTGFRNNTYRELNVPALLEILDIPYTGAGPIGMTLSTDKSLVRAMAQNDGIPVPNELFVDLNADPLVLPNVFPAFIKPNFSDGSFGITEDSVVHDAAQAERQLLWLRDTLARPQALIQDYLTGNEYTVGLIGNPDGGFTVLPPLMVDYSGLEKGLPPIMPYASKADPDSPYWQELRYKPAALDEINHAKLVDYAARLFRRLGYRDYARFDFRCGADGEPRLLEPNHNPTWYWDGKMAMMAGYAGHDYAGLIRLILEAAVARIGL